MRPPYQIDSRILQLVASVSEKIGAVNAAYLHKPPAQLRKKNRIKTIQSSLSIEGNTLSLHQVTALFDKQRVLGPEREVIEVQNAILLYERLPDLDSASLTAFLKAHAVLMKNLISGPGKLRTGAVGIVKGKQVAHLAPPASRLKGLLKDLFHYIRKDPELALIKSCVAHYEIEFIHPFLDGNGRMGRLWQTLILMKSYPVFEYLPVESLIKKKQKGYYEALSRSDKAGQSTAFIQFMLEIIEESLEELLRSQNRSPDMAGRLEIAKDRFGKNTFTRKDYLRLFKNISAPTASRDLAYGVKKKTLKRSGNKRMTYYEFKQSYPL